MKTTFCNLPFTKIKITAYGDVSMCCYQSCNLGNVLRDDFDTIWNSELARDIRQTTLTGELHPNCRNWGGCPYIIGPRVANQTVEENPYPINVELDLPNTHCNVGGVNPTPETACFMCPRAAKNFSPNPDFTFQIVDKVKHLLPTLKVLTILGISEPFWKDRVFDVLDRMEFDKYKENILFYTFTNGTIFNKHRQERFLNACPYSRLLFSVDAATAESYQRIRRLDLFDTVVENIKSYVKCRNPINNFVSLNCNVNVINVQECVKIVELSSMLGVDRVVFNPTHNCGGAVDIDEYLVNQDNAWIFSEMEERAKNRAKELGIDILFFRPLGLDIPVKKKIRLL